MRRPRILFAVIVLILASLACQSLSGGNSSDSVDSSSSAGNGSGADSQSSGSGSSGGSASEGEFPMPDGAYEVQKVGNNINFLVKMDVADALSFYQDEFAKRGYVEREGSVQFNENLNFGAIFEDPNSGKSITVQGFYNVNPDGSMSSEIINVMIIPMDN